MSHKRKVKRSSHTQPIAQPTDALKTKEKEGETPQLLQIPTNFSLWIALFIAIVLLLLIIAGQSSPAPTTSETLQLPSQQSKPLPLGQDGVKLQGINQLPQIKK